MSALSTTAGGAQAGVEEVDELSRSPIGSSLYALYRHARRLRTRRVLRTLLHASLRLEGGEMRSHTARRIMRELHELDIGAYSYGCFDPDRFGRHVTVGRYTSISRSAWSYRRNHPLDVLTTHPFRFRGGRGSDAGDLAPWVDLGIAHDVWIGAHAIVLPGCRSIGTGAVVAAGAVVTRDVEPYTIVAGSPARVIGERFDGDTVARVIESRWWCRRIDDLERSVEHLERSLGVADACRLEERNEP